MDAASTKNHKKKRFLFPESNVAEASVPKVSIFKIINKIPQFDHRDIHNSQHAVTRLCLFAQYFD